jgi:hypothetical protein
MIKFFSRFDRPQKISFLILIFLTVLSLGVGFDKLQNNQLNYNWFLFLAGFLISYKLFTYNLVMIESHIKSKNWFQIGIDSILFFFGIVVTIDAVRKIPFATFPNEVVVNFLVANLLFFVSSYLNKSSKVYFAQLSNLIVILIAGLTLYYLRSYQVPNNIFIMLQAFSSYAICGSELILFFIVSKFSFGNASAERSVEKSIENDYEKYESKSN